MLLSRSISALAASLFVCVISVQADPLPAWKETPLKASLIDFVTKVTKEGGPDFVPEVDRVAVFDNDGTLCTEQPMYFQFAFGQERAKEQAAAHPEWKEKLPYKAALENDTVALGETEVKGLTEIVAGTHVGKTTDELEKSVKDWLAVAKHPTLNRPYSELVYQPMLELLQYLRANGFKTYIVTGSVAEFLRAWSDDAYGIRPEQIIGSNVETTLRVQDGKADVVVAEGAGFINNKANKVLAIERTLGRRPILAFGNSDGDLDMLRFVAGGSGAHWTGLVHHTDADREFAYDGESHFGRLNVGLKDAAKNGWWIVDMKNDWSSVFPQAGGTK